MNIESWATHLMELEENDLITEYKDPSLSASIDTLLLPVTVSSSYYRSKAFTTTTGINQLICAADPLLMFISRIHKIAFSPDPALLQKHLCHEIKAFENKAQTLGYHTQIILAARYILCALIDEIILASNFGHEWPKHALINYFHRDHQEISVEADRFFLILERSLHDPAVHLDLLELLYLCLKFGYEGKYRLIERSHFELRSITDNLYQCIRQQRNDFSKSLLISLDSVFLHSRKKSFLAHLLPPVWSILVFTGLFSVTTFVFFQFQLTKISTPIEQLLTSLKSQESTMNDPQFTASIQ